MNKVTCDTNIIISGVINGHGNSADFLRLLERRKFKLILSEPLLKELSVSFSYPRLKQKYKITDRLICGTIAFLRKNATIVAGDYETDFLSKVDYKDNKVLACALEGKVDYLVTGDKKHILPLKHFHNIKIFTVSDFLSKFFLQKRAMEKLEVKNNNTED